MAKERKKIHLSIEKKKSMLVIVTGNRKKKNLQLSQVDLLSQYHEESSSDLNHTWTSAIYFSGHLKCAPA